VQVRLLTSLASPAGSWDEGDVYTCDDTTAKRMISAGLAVPCAVGGIELAIGEPGPERSVKPRGRRRDHV